jgi:hypothetical protein
VSRYSQLYIDYSAPIPDSQRARHRLGKLLQGLLGPNHNAALPLSELLERELGVKVGVQHAFGFPIFCSQCAIRDFLDTVTVTATYFQNSGLKIQWLSEVRRIFSEEHLAYEIDDNGIVHPAVDEEFQRNRRATVAGLQMPRYANSLVAFERISDELASQPPNGKEAWRAVFTSVEGLFKLMFPPATQLNAGAIDAYLTGVVQKLHQGDAVAQRAANKQVAAFKDWVDASHNYRHEAGSEEPVQPPLDLAVLAISNGTSYLRWLVAIDQGILPNQQAVVSEPSRREGPMPTKRLPLK